MVMERFFVMRALFCFFLVHASTFSFTFAKSASALGNETDHLSLLAFRDGISDDPNRVFSSWNHSLHFCMWVGVTCSRHHPQRVTALNLSSQSLVGSLSPHIGNLSFLKMIDLTFNSFESQIPQEIGHLFRLESLWLESNSISGDIPKNLTHCVQLKELSLYGNKFVGNIPFELSSLTKLEWLDFGKNNLTGHIPPWFGNLSALTILYLTENSLEGSIPNELGQLLKMEFLAASVNRLSGIIPSSIYNLSSLNIFLVARNQLHGTLPTELGLTLPNLKIMLVGGNYFTGHIPRSLANASRLERFDLAANYFVGNVPMSLGRLSRLQEFNVNVNHLGGTTDDDLSFITSLTNCSDLMILELSKNQFGGMLPFSIANLSTHLQYLWLEKNQIFGTIPSGIENLVGLTTLSMYGNQITGTIPVHLGMLSKLEELCLNYNRLSGQLPDSIGNLTRLFALKLGDNNLQGTIPLSLGNGQHLQFLNLSNNKLYGAIPKQLFNSPLIGFDLSNNSFSDSLPLEVGTLENLEMLHIHENKLSGEIPSTLGNCIKLEYLYMGGNFFQGNIPPSLSALKGLRALDLSRNKLHGLLPTYLEQLHYLQYLNLSFNNFVGEVPKQGIFQNTSAISITGNIKLCGGIPRLHLPTCPKPAFKKERRVLSIKVIIGIVAAAVSFLLLLSYFLFAHWLRRSSKIPISSSFMISSFLEITYAELVKATNGFSSTNLIGMGSYGSVYRGIIDRIETTVAIKILKLQQPRSSRSFMAECKALRGIKHRNIVKILTVCSSIDFNGNDFKALVFEYMPNGSLDMWLHPNANESHPSRNLNLIQRINVAIDVACALDYLHHHCQEPIVHCDLKPSNVLLDDDMVAHVSDFGLARILSEDVVSHSWTQSSSLFMRGSIGYVAPEYGTGGDASIHGDIYSYGILLLEMLIGKKPTDEMFKDTLSLPQFAKMALPDRVMEIIDDRLLSEEVEINNNCGDYNKMRQRIQLCLVSLLRIGLSCSVESPKERMEMKGVLKAMYGVRDIYLGVGKYQSKHNKVSLLVEGPSYLSNY